jgi:hypothetical protein
MWYVKDTHLEKTMTIKIIADPLSAGWWNHAPTTSAQREFPILPDAGRQWKRRNLHFMGPRAARRGFLGTQGGAVTSHRSPKFQAGWTIFCAQKRLSHVNQPHYARDVKDFSKRRAIFWMGIRRYINCDGYLLWCTHISAPGAETWSLPLFWNLNGKCQAHEMI